ncbi:MAG: hypothetical protein EXR58_07930 [Chloroflexi bacterium]|nr:hypothetical protein [Chloroflexota bacterium]
MAEPAELPERIQRDLEEALREGGVDKLPKRPRRRRRLNLSFLDLRPRRPGDLVLIGVACFLVGHLLHIFVGQLFLAVFACIAVAVATHLVHPYGAGPRWWRGKYVSLPPNSWQERLYRIIYRRS